MGELPRGAAGHRERNVRGNCYGAFSGIKFISISCRFATIDAQWLWGSVGEEVARWFREVRGGWRRTGGVREGQEEASGSQDGGGKVGRRQEGLREDSEGVSKG